MNDMKTQSVEVAEHSSQQRPTGSEGRSVIKCIIPRFSVCLQIGLFLKHQSIMYPKTSFLQFYSLKFNFC